MERLKDLKERGIKIGIATNTPEWLLLRVLRHLSLESLFDFYVTSSCGYVKPQKEFYKRIIERAGVPPEEILYIGHQVDDLLVREMGIRYVDVREFGRSPRERVDTI